MRVFRRALISSAGAAGLAAALPPRRGYANPTGKAYRLAAKTATVNLTGDGHPDTADVPSPRHRSPGDRDDGGHSDWLNPRR